MSSDRNEANLLAHEKLAQQSVDKRALETSSNILLKTLTDHWLNQEGSEKTVNAITNLCLATIAYAQSHGIAERPVDPLAARAEAEELHVLHGLIDQVLLNSGVTHADIALPKNYEKSMQWIVTAMTNRNEQLKLLQGRLDAAREQAQKLLGQVTR